MRSVSQQPSDLKKDAPSYRKVNIIKIEKNNETLQNPDLELSLQHFNPGTSPPINSFMNRLMVRNITY